MEKIMYVEVIKHPTEKYKWLIRDNKNDFYIQDFWSEKEAKEMMDILNSIPPPKLSCD